MANVPTKLPRYRELPAVRGNPPKTAWGLFGADDNVGMFNLQTPDVVIAAAKLVRKGAVFAMNWEQEKPNPPLFGRGKFRHTVFREIPVGHHGDDCLDNFFTQASSQWDGLTHVGDYEHGFWGGVTGLLFVYYHKYIHPASLSLTSSAEGLIGVIAGGSGTLAGPLIGSAIVMMPFTYSITNGVGAGFLSYSLIALLRGRGKDVHWLMWIVSAIFLWYFVHGAI